MVYLKFKNNKRKFDKRVSNKKAIAAVPFMGLMIFFLVVFSSLIFIYQDDILNIKFEKSVDNPDLFLATSTESCLYNSSVDAIFRASYSGGYIYNLDKNVYEYVENDTSLNKVLIRANDSFLSLNEDVILEDLGYDIRIGFMKCIEEKLDREYYNVKYRDYLGEVVSYDFHNNRIGVSNMDFDEFDKIKIRINDKFYQDNIEKIDNDAVIEFGGLKDKIKSLEHLNSVNLADIPDINIILNDDRIDISLNYSIELINKKKSFFKNNTKVVVQTKFKSNLDRVDSLLKEKLENSSIINLPTKKLMNDSYETLELYTFTELINNRSIDFNFIYYNFIPKIVENNQTNNLIVNDNNLYVIIHDGVAVVDLSKNIYGLNTDDNLSDLDVGNFTNLSTFTSEKKMILKSNDLDGGFKIVDDFTIDYNSHLTSNVDYKIKLSDGKNYREYDVHFVDLNDRNNAQFCFELDSKETVDFPILKKYKNKIFSTVDNSKLFGVINSGISDSMLMLKKNCLDIDYSQRKKIVFMNKDTKKKLLSYPEDNYYKAVLGDVDEVQRIVVKLEGRNEEDSVVLYEFDLYPFGCLGPGIDDNEFELSCCNIDLIDEKIDAIRNNQKIELDKNDVLKKGYELLEREMYFCLDVEDKSGFDFENQIVWNVNPDMTSLYKGGAKFVCGGEYPKLEQNLDSIVSSASDLNASLQDILIKKAGLDDDSSELSFLKKKDGGLDVKIQLEKVSDAGPCEFCSINVESDFKFNVNYRGENFIFKSGFLDAKTKTAKNKKGMISKTVDNSILCDNEWQIYDKVKKKWNILSSFVGKSGDAGQEQISKTFCTQLSSSCSTRKNGNSVGYKKIIDQKKTCIDFYFAPDGSVLKQHNTGWICGERTKVIASFSGEYSTTFLNVCRGGVCRESDSIKNE